MILHRIQISIPFLREPHLPFRFEVLNYKVNGFLRVSRLNLCVWLTVVQWDSGRLTVRFQLPSFTCRLFLTPIILRIAEKRLSFNRECNSNAGVSQVRSGGHLWPLKGSCLASGCQEW